MLSVKVQIIWLNKYLSKFQVNLEIVIYSMCHKALLTGCEAISRGEEMCVLYSLRFNLLGLLLISVLFSGSGDFKTTFAMIFFAVEKQKQHKWRYE